MKVGYIKWKNDLKCNILAFFLCKKKYVSFLNLQEWEKGKKSKISVGGMNVKRYVMFLIFFERMKNKSM